MELSLNGEIEVIHKTSKDGFKTTAVEYRGGVLSGPDASQLVKAGVYKGGFVADVKVTAKASGDFINQSVKVVAWKKVW